MGGVTPTGGGAATSNRAQARTPEPREGHEQTTTSDDTIRGHHRGARSHPYQQSYRATGCQRHHIQEAPARRARDSAPATAGITEAQSPKCEAARGIATYRHRLLANAGARKSRARAGKTARPGEKRQDPKTDPETDPRPDPGTDPETDLTPHRRSPLASATISHRSFRWVGCSSARTRPQRGRCQRPPPASPTSVKPAARSDAPPSSGSVYVTRRR